MQRHCQQRAGQVQLRQLQQAYPRGLCPVTVLPTARRSPRQTKTYAFDRDPFFELTPFMSREMAIMDQQMEQMSRQMDSEMARMMGMAQRMEAQANQQAEQALERAQRLESGVQIRRTEERGTNSYRYYESISISMGPRVYVPATAQPAQPSPLLFAAVLLTGAWAVLAAAFARNVHLTTFKDQSGWQLGLMWPFLLVSNSSFRRQFLAAVRGQRAPLQSMDEQQ